MEQRLKRLERELTRLGASGQNANQQAQGSASRGTVVVTSDPLAGQIPESQVVFDDTGGHDHSTSGTPVPMAGEVTGTNTAATVTLTGDVSGTALVNSVDKIHGKTAPSAPASTDAGKALRYDGSTAYVLQGGRLRIRTVTGTATFGADDDTILGDTTGGAFSVNLPAVASSNRFVYTLKRISAGANNLTLQANGAETIDGANTYVLTTQYAFVVVQGDGAAWWIVGKG